MNKLVAKRRQDTLDRLRQDHEAHLVDIAKRNGMRRLMLATIDRLDSGAEDFRLKGAVEMASASTPAQNTEIEISATCGSP